MKCKYCGGNLDLENKYCPHCGRPNDLAAQHIRDMERFQGEFTRTRKDVYRHASRWSGVFVRAIILSVLIVAIFAVSILTRNAWSLRRRLMESEANRKYAEYSAQLDQYLAEGDYRGFYVFMDYHHMDIYDSPYQKYSALKWTAMYYGQIIDYTMRLVFRSPYASYGHYYDYLAEDLKDFYRYSDPAHYSVYDGLDEEFVRPHWERMERTIDDVLMTYLGLTEEETKALRTMSDSRRALLLEERIEALTGDAGESYE